MESIRLLILIGPIGGAAAGLQSPLASLLSRRLGVFGLVVIRAISA
jgi:hypothetical protein